MTDLDQLIAAVEGEALNRAMCYAFFPQRHEHADEDLAHHMMAAQLGSLDAAHRIKVAIVPELGCAMNLELGLVRLYGKGINGSVGAEVKDNLARALLLASLKAKRILG